MRGYKPSTPRQVPENVTYNTVLLCFSGRQVEKCRRQGGISFVPFQAVAFMQFLIGHLGRLVQSIPQTS